MHTARSTTPFLSAHASRAVMGEDAAALAGFALGTSPGAKSLPITAAGQRPRAAKIVGVKMPTSGNPQSTPGSVRDLREEIERLHVGAVRVLGGVHAARLEDHGDAAARGLFEVRGKLLRRKPRLETAARRRRA